MEMLCCSPRSASSLLERAGLFPRTDEEYELRVIVWEARAVAIEPPKARLPQWTQRSAPPSSTRLRPMYCVYTTPTHQSLPDRDTRPKRLRLGAQAGKHVAVRVQPRGKVPANYVLQQTDDCPCNTEGDTEFNWRMRWPMSAMEKAPTLHIAVGNSYGANDTLGAQHVQPSPPPSPYPIRPQALALTLILRFLAEGELSLEALCERAAKRRTGQFLDTCANCKSPTPTRNCNRIPQPLPNPDPITRWVKCTRPGNAAGPATASVCLTVEVLRAAPRHGQKCTPLAVALAVPELVPRTSSASGAHLAALHLAAPGRPAAPTGGRM